jgi:hypothetical protein
MPRSTTRIELHDADEDDYENLHDAMAKEGFSRFISDSEGKKYHLPTAEYNSEAYDDKDEALKAAKRAAKAIGFNNDNFEVLVTMSDGRTWYNLDPK